MQEIWKDIKDYEGLYSVSNTGKVYSHKRNRLLSTPATGWSHGGYCFVQLRKEGKGKIKYIHRLVAEAFIPNPENKPEVNHIDHDNHNNLATNLEWVTHDENIKAYNKYRIQKGVQK